MTTAPDNRTNVQYNIHHNPRYHSLAGRRPARPTPPTHRSTTMPAATTAPPPPPRQPRPRSHAQRPLVHGLTAATAVLLPGESRAEYDALETAAGALTDPSTPLTAALAARLASIVWRLHRIPEWERRVLDADASRLHAAAPMPADPDAPPIPPDLAAAIAAITSHSQPDQADQLALLARYEAHLSRELIRALATIHALRQLEATA